jgi:hypothetical protein
MPVSEETLQRIRFPQFAAQLLRSFENTLEILITPVTGGMRASPLT